MPELHVVVDCVFLDDVLAVLNVMFAYIKLLNNYYRDLKDDKV